MTLNLYQIDAFTDSMFGGNPACVVPLKDWLPDALLLKIARENAVAETAFYVDNGDSFHLRWFTPEIEMDLCGHATLATAHCLKTILGYNADRFVFTSRSGDLPVTVNNGWYTLDFPSRKPVAAVLPDNILQALSIKPMEVLQARDYVLVYENEEQIRDIQINRPLFDQLNLDPGGVVITAPGTNCDFVSRFFTPQASIFEDPVTGSAHCSLVPYWAEKLGKQEMLALQLSERVGTLVCENKGDRVLIGGQAKTYSTAVLWTE
jgi:PhzF family phenazine biosynthesis protein